jgi:hypothetical protein
VDGALPPRLELHGSLRISFQVPIRIRLLLTLYLYGRQLANRDYSMLHSLLMLAKMFPKRLKK